MEKESKENSDDAIIAQFMGASIDGPEYENQYAHFKDIGAVLIDRLKYRTSWDWLHPVVDKIGELMPDIKIPEHLEALKNGTHGSEPYIDVVSLPIRSDIKDVYEAVVKFIKCFNTQPK